jgi:hypothetical protein
LRKQGAEEDEKHSMMKFFRVTDREFYGDERAAKMINNVGVRHNKADQHNALVLGPPN